MKRFEYLLLAAMAISCTKTGDDTIFNDSANRGDVIPVQTALANMTETLQSLYPQTRAGEGPVYNASDVIVLGKNNLFPVTKSGEGMEIPDTLLYVVNFNDEEGFAVLAGDSRLTSPVLCVTEKGSLSAEDFVEAVNLMQRETKSVESVPQDMGESFVPALILSSTLATLQRTGEGGGRGDEGGGNNGEGGENNPDDDDNDYPFMQELPDMGGPTSLPDPLGPYVMTKWTQNIDHPFRTYTPNHALPGCSAIALAQVVLANRYANTTTFDNVFCDWEEMEGVQNYQNYQQMSYTGSELGKEQVAHFVFAIGRDYLGLDYSSGAGTIGGSVIGNYLKDAMLELGYNATLEYNLFSFSNTLKQKTYDMLREGLPVVARGNPAGSLEGHVWVIDGYRYVLTYVDHFFHVNWGWHGNRDGYYSLGVFNTENGRFTHSVYDDPAQLSTGNADNYTWNFAVVDYSF